MGTQISPWFLFLPTDRADVSDEKMYVDIFALLSGLRLGSLRLSGSSAGNL